MINKIKLPENKKKDYVNYEYVKCLAEGIKDWLDVKIAVGNADLLIVKGKIRKEIVSPPKNLAPQEFSLKILERMKELGIERDNIKEFKGVFINQLKLRPEIA